MSNFVTLVCAAGASSRMAPQDKLLLEVAGQPLLRRIVDRCVELNAQTWVLLPDNHGPRAQALSNCKALRWSFQDSAQGLGGTLSAAARRIGPDITHVMVVLADMPDLSVLHLARMRMAPRDFPDAKVWRATAPDGTAGHPTVFAADVFKSLTQLTGDTGAKDLIAAYASQTAHVTFQSNAVTTDIDTADDWHAWRTGQLE